MILCYQNKSNDKCENQYDDEMKYIKDKLLLDLRGVVLVVMEGHHKMFPHILVELPSLSVCTHGANNN